MAFQKVILHRLLGSRLQLTAHHHGDRHIQSIGVPDGEGGEEGRDCCYGQTSRGLWQEVSSRILTLPSPPLLRSMPPPHFCPHSS